MKTVKYQLSAKVNKLNMMITDIFGGEWPLSRHGYIGMSWKTGIDYETKNPDFDYIKEEAISEGIQVSEDTYVAVAKIKLLSEEPVEVKYPLITLQYMLFKPKLKCRFDLKCEEVI